MILHLWVGLLASNEVITAYEDLEIMFKNSISDYFFHSSAEISAALALYTKPSCIDKRKY